jgi:hypothetical protein
VFELRKGQQKRRVRIAAPEQHRASSVRKGRLDERAGIEQAHVVLAVELRARGDGLARYNAAAVAAEARGVAARIEVDAFDEAGVNHRGSGAHVEQVRNGDPVEEIADIARRRATNEEKREAADDGRDARHHLDGAERVPEHAGNLTYLGARQGGRTRGLAASPVDRDFLNVGPDRGSGGRWGRSGRLAGGRRGLWKGRTRSTERDLDVNSRGDRLAAAGGRLETPQERGLGRREIKWLVRFRGNRGSHGSVVVDRNDQHDDRIARRAVRVSDDGLGKESGWDQLNGRRRWSFSLRIERGRPKPRDQDRDDGPGSARHLALLLPRLRHPDTDRSRNRAVRNAPPRFPARRRSDLENWEPTGRTQDRSRPSRGREVNASSPA